MKRSTNPPHIFATADAAYQSMVTLSKDQVLLSVSALSFLKQYRVYL